MDGAQTKASSERSAAKSAQGLSAAALDKRLALKKQARNDAARNLPRHDAGELSAAELAVLEAVAHERAQVDQVRNQAKAEAERRLRALAPTPQDFAGPALDARLGLKQAEGRIAHDWRAAAARARQAHADLEAFKRTHSLRRSAVYPRSTLLQAGLLLSAAVFEALFSAALFAEDDARGLLGGAITAIGLSGANVTLGYLAGFLGLRYLQHVKLPVKAIGALAFAAFALLALMLNLFAADWRDRLAALAGRQLDMGSDAGFHIWSLLQLDSPQAIILLMLGAGVWVFAALKGYSGFDDPYPDYGKMARSTEAAAEALSDFRADARGELEAPVELAKAALAARLEKMRAEFEAMSKGFDAAALKMEQLDAKARALDDAAAAAIHLYRQENIAHRTAPAPLYFSAAPPAAGPSLDALGAAAAMIDEARNRLNDAQRQSTQALEELLAELNAATARLDVGEDA
ncbi:MAG TPA: hypothetical protein VEA80_13975 [Vitreimonas sp.]|uniref:hypothetical protein n=1 Tax=Vitreimonas sp. TaxID=3069702 RepID=UPI002D2D18EA|nr:hypothetical protein [Vitreimonas sp.]HYD88577.1 hypothetical protein [Vitreimonas sp.]